MEEPIALTKASMFRLAMMMLLVATLDATIAPRGAGSQTSPFALVSPERAAAMSASPNANVRSQAMFFGDQALMRAPHAMPGLHIEGSMPHTAGFDQSTEAIKDFKAARDLAIAGRVSGMSRYDDHAADLLAAWIAVYQPDFNPIDETSFSWMIVAYDVLQGRARQRIAPRMNQFLRRLADGYLDRFPTLAGPTAVNNWQSHRIMLVTLAGYALDDRSVIARAKAAFIGQLTNNIRSDGSTVDFAERDAVHYAAYDLEPLAMAALAAREHGDDWYHLKNRSGVGLEEALRWLQPYAEGTRTHQEFDHTSVQFDVVRRGAGVAGFSGAFDPRDARDTMVVAARLDQQFIPATRAVEPGSSSVLFNLTWPLPE